jgi:hypothetical protein
LAVVFVLVAALVLLLRGLYPADLPHADDPNFIDAIFNNKAVIWAARALLVSAAVVLAVGGVSIVASTVVREFWRSTALDGQVEVAELRERLEESDDLIGQLHLALDDG